MEINRKVWDRNVNGYEFTLGVLVARMAKYYKDVELLRGAMERVVTDNGTAVAHTKDFVDNAYNFAMGTLLRLKLSSVYGLGFNKQNVYEARNHIVPKIGMSDYLVEVA